MRWQEALSSEPEEIRGELRQLLASGLPVTDTNAGELLPNQRVVVAHAQHPDQRASRITALERVARELLRGLGDNANGHVARSLFAAESGLRGTKLGHRRDVAARGAERSTDHVRQKMEPKILDELAFAFHQQNLRYTPRVDKLRPEIAGHEDAPVLGDGSYTKREEDLSRLWSAVYGYRAEIIGVQRRLDDGETEDEVQDQLGAARWELGRLLTLVHEWLEEYGEEIEMGDVEYKAEGLILLAGWSGGLDSEVARRVRLEWVNRR